MTARQVPVRDLVVGDVVVAVQGVTMVRPMTVTAVTPALVRHDAGGGWLRAGGYGGLVASVAS